MSERITQELRDGAERYCNFKNDTIVKFKEDDFDCLCDAIDSIHANLERENDRLKCELDRVLGELDGMHKTDGISDNSSSFMHEVSITNELREFARRWPCTDYIHKDMLAIADRIDAEHEREMRETGEDIVRDVRREWVRLPVDADGVPIHIGDRMEWVRYKDDDPTIVRTVSGIGNGVFFAWSDEQGRYAQYEAHAYRHHHADSWERIIEDAVNVHGNGFNPCWTDERDALVARCKALAGDAE